MRALSELRWRNVRRMAVLYAVAACLIMQVAEVLVTFTAPPEWVGQIVLVLLAVGFPSALISSWFCELTPVGMKSDTRSGGAA